jgi:hypothetical protein
MDSLDRRVLQVVIEIDQDAINEHESSFDPNIPRGMDVLLNLRQYIPNVVSVDFGCESLASYDTDEQTLSRPRSEAEVW